MSSLQSMIDPLILNNYFSLMGCTIVGYDFILTFPREVEYIWRKRWSWVTVLFFLVRYPGLCWALLTSGLIGTTFITGPVNVYAYEFWYICNILFLVSCWTFPVFICAADLVMVMRVYTIWGRSKPILYSLLFVFAAQAIVSVVLPAIYNSNPNYFTPTVAQVLNFSLCSGTFSPSVPILLGLYNAIPRFALGIMLLVLATAQTLKQLIQMYNATKLIQPNRYLGQFARDGFYYFLINTVYNVVNVIGSLSPITANFSVVAVELFGTLSMALICSAMPRFIISVREMYDHDLLQRLQGIDSGFGVFSQTDTTLAQSGIAFADIAQGSLTLRGDAEELGAIQLEDARKKIVRSDV